MLHIGQAVGDTLRDIRLRHNNTNESVQVVYLSHGVNAQTVLFNTGAIAKACGAIVPGPGINLGEPVTQYSSFT